MSSIEAEAGRFEAPLPRYLVVEADARGYMDKDVGCAFYRFDNYGDAHQFAMRRHEDLVGKAMNQGGYPGTTYVLDLDDPTDFDDPQDVIDMWTEMEIEPGLQPWLNEEENE